MAKLNRQYDKEFAELVQEIISVSLNECVFDTLSEAKESLLIKVLARKLLGILKKDIPRLDGRHFLRRCGL